MDARAGKEVHDLINFVGLRAQATAVGLIQLTAELAKAGVLQEDAVTRIKSAIADELELSRPSTVSTSAGREATRGGSSSQLDGRYDRNARIAARHSASDSPT